ncbi:MAG TPA: hypothetical protein VK256_13565 [Candidatus Eisenbacteria bacterium]|nr:hypothetical protein [Candidatus Eisenbacteria bacterium]
MNRLGRLLDSLLPALIHLNPTVATAYYQAVAMDEGSHNGVVIAERSPLVFHALGVVTVIDLADVSPPAFGRIMTRARR